MSDAICAEALSKSYRLGTAQTKYAYRTLRESVGGWLKSAVGRRAEPPLFWALDRVDFTVKPGEVVGVVGRNGAGKSTLLKILSRITKPTSGRVTLEGRVGSLLEVGTGFHPELTGRENIYLNGSILGMSRREITRKFDAIVDFAETEQFLDTPVKRYSSGMYVRLAFAVAAYLEPEILIVDEVLAVGDAAFQKKCMGRMRSIGQEGRTILFVSHNMAAVAGLCTRATYLEKGRVVADGEPNAIIEQYVSAAASLSGGTVDLTEHPHRRLGCRPILRRVTFRNAAGIVTDTFPCGEPMTIDFDVDPQGASIENPIFGIGVDNALAQRIFSVATYLADSPLPAVTGPMSVRCHVGPVALAPGSYTLNLSAGRSGESVLDAIDTAVCIEIVPNDFYGNGRMPEASLGNVLVGSRWEALA